MKTPKISVVMSAYNEEKYLDESIGSILSQTFKDFELIIVNDCSTDNSIKIMRKYAKKDKRIKVINSPNNEGIVKTRNKALIVARGKYIANLDGDDISTKNRLEIQYNYLESHPEIFLVGSSAIVIDDYSKNIGILRKQNNLKKIEKKLKKSNPLVLSSVMFRNEKILYREKLESTEDYDLYLRILTSGKKITNLPLFLVKYRMHSGSISQTRQVRQALLFLKAKEFYFQRKKYGKDNYESFDATNILNKKDDKKHSQNIIQSRIVAEFQAGYMKRVRRDIRIIAREQGLNKKLIFYYISSFFPIKLIRFFKENIL